MWSGTAAVTSTSVVVILRSCELKICLQAWGHLVATVKDIVLKVVSSVYKWVKGFLFMRVFLYECDPLKSYIRVLVYIP